jgi:hypothetical protein
MCDVGSRHLRMSGLRQKDKLPNSGVLSLNSEFVMERKTIGFPDETISARRKVL